MVDKRDLVNVFDCEAAAREKLPKTAYDYYRSGANDEITLRENHAACERIQLHPRVLKDISKSVCPGCKSGGRRPTDYLGAGRRWTGRCQADPGPAA